MVVDYITKVDQFIIEKTLTNHRTFGYSTRKYEKVVLGDLVRSTQDQYQSNSKHPTGALNLREHQSPYLKNETIMNMSMQPTNTTESTNLPNFCLGELNLSIMQTVSEIVTNPNYHPFKQNHKK